MMTSTALVWLMIPGVGFFYSGLARRKSALSLIWLSLMSIAIVSFQVIHSFLNDTNGQWFLWGYSLAFSKTASPFIGNLDNFGFKGVLGQKTGNVPDLTFAIFQCMFAAITPA